ncbi:hypothetical protein CP532_6282 [Ophiocordyceps camponoti-leonardi (nom. inval.)]|nr:hypothetical protein CP532_6282 [Ophiocordyceps camponoti-leonardi (nom. inval.)]
MELFLSCNNLKCRKDLIDRAVITACSHILCVDCMQQLDLDSSKPLEPAKCLACLCPLEKPTDAVMINLNPTEDYKTTALSGLSPNIIFECACRALNFWTYQRTQEVSYQQFLHKTLLEKYTSLRAQMNQIATDANSEIERLRQRISSRFTPSFLARRQLIGLALAAEQSILRQKNEELAQAYKQKSRKLLQARELCNKLKRNSEIRDRERAASDTNESTFRVTDTIGTITRDYNTSNSELNL